MGNRRVTTDPQFPGVYAVRDSRKQKAVFAVVYGDYTACGCGLSGCTHPPDIYFFLDQRQAANYAKCVDLYGPGADRLRYISIPKRKDLL